MRKAEADTAAAAAPRRDEDLRILIVDDHPENLVATAAVLEDIGTIATATSGREALRKLLEHDHAVLLLDVQMADMDGYETARLIRQRERHRDTPIIFLTAAQQGEASVQEGYDAGAVDYVFKPFEPHVLRAKVRAFVELARHRRLLEDEVERRRRAEDELRAMAADLERRIAERTRELEVANADLRGHVQVTTQLRSQLEAASRRKDEFLAVLGHELRNPLAALANASSALQAIPPGAPEAAAMTAIVLRQVERLRRLVDDLLDIGRITRGAFELRRADVDLRAVIEQAARACAPLMAATRHELVVDTPDQPVPVNADTVRLEQVVNNLLDNAAKYTPAGTRIHLALSIDRETHPAHAVLRVIDEGEGVAPAMRHRVFDLFTRGQAVGVEAAGGFGVGLALCRQIMELHGGSIALAPGRGNEFVVTMPLGAHAAKPEPAADGDGGDLLPRRRVLIVEDNADAAASLALMLRAWGSEPTVAPDGAAAIAAVEKEVPDLVLLDIGLPGMDGHEVARRLRAIIGREVPIAAATGFGRDVDRMRALEAGCDFHLTKPIGAAVLRDLILKGHP